MTVSYTQKVSESTFCGFSRLLFRWRGSVFKLIWRNLLVYVVLYFFFSFLYRVCLSEDQKRMFENIVIGSTNFRENFKITFVLGFYVLFVVERWWAQYLSIPWPDTICILASSYIQGEDERGLFLRKTFARYINLSFCLTFSMLSPSVEKRFNSYDKMIEEGYMTTSEKEVFEHMDQETEHHKLWMIFTWACLVVVKAKKEGKVLGDYGQVAIIKEIMKLRRHCGKLLEYHEISIPLVYTQVVTIATYSHFFFTLLGHQYLDPDREVQSHVVDIYVPIISILEFIFYVGLLKVAECLFNPFGGDDDDFEMNNFLDRHFLISDKMVDVMHREHPDSLQDWQRDDKKLMLHDVPFNLNSVSIDSINVPQSSRVTKLYPDLKIFEAEDSAPSSDTDDDYYYTTKL